MAAPMRIAFQANAIRDLAAAANGDISNLKKQLKTAVRATSKHTKAVMAKSISDKVVLTQKVIKKTIKDITVPTDLVPRAEITIEETARIPLRDYKGNQTKKGVTYRISKDGKKSVVPGAFQGPKPGARKISWRGRVFKRVGKSRLPIIQLFGPSPWGVFTKNEMIKPTQEEADNRLIKEIEKRTRAIQGGWIRADNQRIKRNA